MAAVAGALVSSAIGGGVAGAVGGALASTVVGNMMAPDGSSGGGGSYPSSTGSAYGSNNGSPIPNLQPQVVKGDASNLKLAGDFTNPILGYAAGHQVHESIPAQYIHGRSMGELEGDFGNFPEFSHFAEGGEAEHNPEFYSEGGLQHTYVKGGGDGTSDSVPAMLATGEFVIPADVVSGLGNGDSDAGSHLLDGMIKNLRKHKQSNSPDELPPDSKHPLEYLKGVA